MSAEPEKTLFENAAFRLTATRVTQQDCEAVLEGVSTLHITRKGEARRVEIPAVPQGMPGYRGPLPVLNAMYAMATNELRADLNEEGLLKAGAAWSGVWTRDIAYAAILGSCIADPAATRLSLESRIQGGRILQDTGTGGGWPISTDRVVWCLGAWTYYQLTGDVDWLARAADVIIATFEQDEEVVQRDGHLFAGESSFLDWREQSYPNWMKPADIGASYAFGTNVLHSCCRSFLARMLHLLGRDDEAEQYATEGTAIAQAIREKFWNRAMLQYGMIRSSDNYLDERADALACALAVLSGVADDKGRMALQTLPQSLFGTPVFSPCKCSQASYHNRTVWPFAEAFVLLAHAEMQNTAAAARSMAFLLRAAMMFGTNKENLNALTGEAEDTLQNSDRQLWSVSGMLGLFYYSLFGIQFEKGNLVFAPCVPKAYAGSHWLMGLKIRDFTIDIHINGYGTDICSVLVNGKVGSPLIPLNSSGRIVVELELIPSEDEEEEPAVPAMQEDLFEPVWNEPTPELLRWQPVEGARAYRVYCNGKALTQTAACEFRPKKQEYASYRIQALNDETQSYPGEPYECFAQDARLELPPQSMGEEHQHRVENGQAWLDSNEFTAPLNYGRIELGAGTYQLRLRYSNATNSLRDGDSCALRALYWGEKCIGFIALPHHTECGSWEDFTLTAAVQLHIEKAEAHEFSLRLTPECIKGGQGINQCMVRELQITRIANAPAVSPAEENS